jgi:hypothetical protein
MPDSRLAADCRALLPQATSLFTDSKKNRETDIGFQNILADQHHADLPSEPRQRVHIESKTFSVGNQQYYVDLLIAATETLFMSSVIMIDRCKSQF